MLLFLIRKQQQQTWEAKCLLISNSIYLLIKLSVPFADCCENKQEIFPLNNFGIFNKVGGSILGIVSLRGFVMLSHGNINKNKYNSPHSAIIQPFPTRNCLPEIPSSLFNRLPQYAGPPSYSRNPNANNYISYRKINSLKIVSFTSCLIFDKRVWNENE